MIFGSGLGPQRITIKCFEVSQPPLLAESSVVAIPFQSTVGSSVYQIVKSLLLFLDHVSDFSLSDIVLKL